MNYIDYIIIGITFLFFIVGFAKGFFKKIFSKLCGLLAFGGAIFLAKPLSEGAVKPWFGEKLLGALNNNEQIYNYTTIAIGFLASFIALIIILLIVSWLLGKLVKGDGKKSILDRILGALFGLVKAFIFLEVVMMICLLVANFVPSFNDYLISILHINDGQFSIGNELYKISKIVIDFIQTKLNY